MLNLQRAIPRISYSFFSGNIFTNIIILVFNQNINFMFIPLTKYLNLIRNSLFEFELLLIVKHINSGHHYGRGMSQRFVEKLTRCN